MKLIASRPLTYATRRLLPGDPFVTDDRVARVLIAAKKAVKDTGKQSAVSRPSPNDRTALRAEYEHVLGKKPFHGWDAATLQQKIAAAKG